MNLENLVKDLFKRVKQDNQVEEVLEQLSMISFDEMKIQLSGDNQKNDNDNGHPHIGRFTK